MRNWPRSFASRWSGLLKLSVVALLSVLIAPAAFAQAGGEANLKLPDLSSVNFLGVDGHRLLMVGILFCIFGLGFGLVIYSRLKNLPVHRSMREISELIYETCKTYLVTQGKFLLLLWVFIAVIILLYFGVLLKYEAARVIIILAFSVVGIAGSYGVAWFGIRVNTFANSRTAFASLRGKPYPIYRIPLSAGMSIGMMLISVELLIMLFILLFIPGDYAGPCFIGFAIGESLGAAALRIAGGIFTKIADIGSDLMKIVFKIKEDDARNPGVIADCTGDNAGDSVGPSADGFETYGVTGVALITFILLGVRTPAVQVELLVWIFVMRIMMLVASAAAYFINAGIAKARYENSNDMSFEAPLTSLVWITSAVSIALTFLISNLIIPDLGGDGTQWWKLASIISCGTLAGAIIPELVKVFTSVESRHTREVVISAQEGGASLGILSGFVAGNFSAYYLGGSMVTHVCVDPPGSPNEWNLDALRRHKDHVESFGLSLDMVQLPISAGPLRAQDKPHVLIANGPEWQLEIDSLCGLIERLAAAGIPAAKYNLSVLGVLRTAPELGRGGSRNKAFRWSWVDPNTSPTLAGVISEEENWERIDRFLAAVVPVATATRVRLACHPHDPHTQPGWRGITRVLGTVEGLKRFVTMHESPLSRPQFLPGHGRGDARRTRPRDLRCDPLVRAERQVVQRAFPQHQGPPARFHGNLPGRGRHGHGALARDLSRCRLPVHVDAGPCASNCRTRSFRCRLCLLLWIHPRSH